MHNKFFAKSYLLILLPLLVSCQNMSTSNREVFTDSDGREVTIKGKNVRCKIIIKIIDIKKNPTTPVSVRISK